MVTLPSRLRPPWASALLGALLASCASLPPAPERAVPTPESVTKDAPGGDADDPGEAALKRLLDAPWGTRTDKFHTLRVRFPDWGNWRRVRFWGFPTRAGFRYGDDHHAVAALFYLPAEPNEGPARCLERFLSRARSIAKTFSLELGEVHRELGVSHPRASVLEPTGKPPGAPPDAMPEQRRVDKPLPIVRTEASFKALTDQGHWFVAAAAYSSWPGTCVVQGLAVDGDDHPELAQAVLDRWVREGTAKLIWERALWEAPPYENR